MNNVDDTLDIEIPTFDLASAVDHEETTSLWCQSCQKLQQEVKTLREEQCLNYSTLKQKIVSTDLLIKKYKAKCEDYDDQVKKLEDVSKQLEKVQRESNTLGAQLRSSLQEIEPLKKFKINLETEKRLRDYELQILQDKLNASERTRQQLSELTRSTFSVRDKFEDERKEHLKKIQSLEATNQKQEKEVSKIKDECKSLKSDNTQAMKKQKTMERNLQKIMERVERYWKVLKLNGLLPKGDKKMSVNFIAEESDIWSHEDTTEESLIEEVSKYTLQEEVIDSEDEDCDSLTNWTFSPLVPMLSPLPPSPLPCSGQDSNVDSDADVDMTELGSMLEEKLMSVPHRDRDHDAHSVNNELVSSISTSVAKHKTRRKKQKTRKNKKLAERRKPTQQLEMSSNDERLICMDNDDAMDNDVPEKLSCDENINISQGATLKNGNGRVEDTIVADVIHSVTVADGGVKEVESVLQSSDSHNHISKKIQDDISNSVGVQKSSYQNRSISESSGFSETKSENDISKNLQDDISQNDNTVDVQKASIHDQSVSESSSSPETMSQNDISTKFRDGISHNDNTVDVQKTSIHDQSESSSSPKTKSQNDFSKNLKDDISQNDNTVDVQKTSIHDQSESESSGSHKTKSQNDFSKNLKDDISHNDNTVDVQKASIHDQSVSESSSSPETMSQNDISKKIQDGISQNDNTVDVQKPSIHDQSVSESNGSPETMSQNDISTKFQDGISHNDNTVDVQKTSIHDQSESESSGSHKTKSQIDFSKNLKDDISQNDNTVDVQKTSIHDQSVSESNGSPDTMFQNDITKSSQDDISHNDSTACGQGSHSIENQSPLESSTSLQISHNFKSQNFESDLLQNATCSVQIPSSVMKHPVLDLDTVSQHFPQTHECKYVPNDISKNNTSGLSEKAETKLNEKPIEIHKAENLDGMVDRSTKDDSSTSDTLDDKRQQNISKNIISGLLVENEAKLNEKSDFVKTHKEEENVICIVDTRRSDDSSTRATLDTGQQPDVKVEAEACSVNEAEASANDQPKVGQTETAVDVKVKKEPLDGAYPRRITRSQSFPAVLSMDEKDVIDLTKTQNILQKLAFFVSERQSSKRRGRLQSSPPDLPRVRPDCQTGNQTRSDSIVNKLVFDIKCSSISLSDDSSEDKDVRYRERNTSRIFSDVTVLTSNTLKNEQKSENDPDLQTDQQTSTVSQSRHITGNSVSERNTENNTSPMKQRRSPRISKLLHSPSNSFSKKKEKMMQQKSPNIFKTVNTVCSAKTENLYNFITEKSPRIGNFEKITSLNTSTKFSDTSDREKSLQSHRIITQTMMRQVSTGFVPKSSFRKSICIDQDELKDGLSDKQNDFESSQNLSKKIKLIADDGIVKETNNRKSSKLLKQNAFHDSHNDTSLDAQNTVGDNLEFSSGTGWTEGDIASYTKLREKNNKSKINSVSKMEFDRPVSPEISALTCELSNLVNEKSISSISPVSVHSDVFKMSPFHVISPLSPLPLSPVQSPFSLEDPVFVDSDPPSGLCLFSSAVPQSSKTVKPKPVRSSIDNRSDKPVRAGSSQSSIDNESDKAVRNDSSLTSNNSKSSFLQSPKIKIIPIQPAPSNVGRIHSTRSRQSLNSRKRKSSEELKVEIQEKQACFDSDTLLHNVGKTALYTGIYQSLEHYLKTKTVSAAEMEQTLFYDRPAAEVIATLMQCGVQILSSSTVDLMPAINKACSCEEVYGPFLSDVELRLSEFFRYLLKDTEMMLSRHVVMEILWNGIFSRETTSLFGKMALCRVFTHLCQDEGDVEQVRVIFYHVMMCGYLPFLPLAVAIVAVWPSTLLKSASVSASPMVLVMEHILGSTASEGHENNQLFQCLRKLCDWSEAATEDVALIKLLIKRLKSVNFSESRDESSACLFELMKSIEVLCRHKKWDWVHKYLIRQQLQPIFRQYCARAVTADLFPEIVKSAVQLMGAVICPENKPPINYINKVVKKELVVVLNKIPGNAGVQHCCVEVMLLLAPYDSNRIFSTLTNWYAKHKDNIPEEVGALIVSYKQMFINKMPLVAVCDH